MLELPVIIKTATQRRSIRLSLSPISDHVLSLKYLWLLSGFTLAIDPGYDLMRTFGPVRTAGHLVPVSRGLLKQLAILLIRTTPHPLRFFIDSSLRMLKFSVLLQDEATDEDLTENSLLFLGTESRLSRSLFALPDHPAGGFHPGCEKKPLEYADQVAVLVSAANEEQVERAAAKLRHYGKYSYLSFKDGRIQDKRITETDFGLQAPTCQPASRH